MITKNAKNYLKLCATHGNIENFSIPSGVIKDTTGTFCTGCISMFHPFAIKVALASLLQTDESMDSSNYGLYLRLGTGSTAPSENDYCLESEIESYSEIGVLENSSSYSINFNEDGTKVVCENVINITLKNNKTEDIQINEIGITRGLFRYKTYNNSRFHDVILLYREVLSEPVTISPAGTFTITKTITIEQETGYDFFS